MDTMEQITPPSPELLKHFKDYAGNIKITAGSRFEASRRLKDKDSASAITIAILSLYTIAVSLIDFVPSLHGTRNVENIPVVTILSSILVLVMSLLEYSRQYAVRALQMQQCGQELNEIYYEIDLMLKSDRLEYDGFVELKRKYDRVIDKYPENHTQLDFHYWRATHSKNVRDKGIKMWHYVLWYKTQSILHKWLLYCILLSVPPIIALYLMQT